MPNNNTAPKIKSQKFKVDSESQTSEAEMNSGKGYSFTGVPFQMPMAVNRLEPYSGGNELCEWIPQFKLMAKQNKWDDGDLVENLPYFLAGTALKWYNQDITGAATKITDIDDIFERMKESLLSPNYDDFQFEQMEQRTQKPNEYVQDYCYDKKQLCLGLKPKLEEKDIVKKIMDGMLPHIKAEIEKCRPTNTKELFIKAKAIERSNKILRSSIQSSEMDKVTSMLAELKTEVKGITGPSANQQSPIMPQYPAYFNPFQGYGSIYPPPRFNQFGPISQPNYKPSYPNSQQRHQWHGQGYNQNGPTSNAQPISNSDSNGQNIGNYHQENKRYNGQHNYNRQYQPSQQRGQYPSQAAVYGQQTYQPNQQQIGQPNNVRSDLQRSPYPNIGQPIAGEQPGRFPTRTATGQVCCYTCGQPGHIFRNCPNNQVQILDDIRQYFGYSQKDDHRLFKIHATCDGIPASAVVDTGSTITIVSDKIWAATGKSLNKWDGLSYFGINGGQVQPLGGCVMLMDLTCGKQTTGPIEHKVMVLKDFNHDVLLGLDLMKKAMLNIDIPNEKTTIIEKEVEATQTDNTSDNETFERYVNISAEKEVDIPANYTKIIKVTTIDKQLETSGDLYGIINLDKAMKKKLTTPRSVVQLINGKTELDLTNKTKDNIYLSKGQMIGHFEKADTDILVLTSDAKCKTRPLSLTQTLMSAMVLLVLLLNSVLMAPVMCTEDKKRNETFVNTDFIETELNTGYPIIFTWLTILSLVLLCCGLNNRDAF